MNYGNLDDPPANFFDQGNRMNGMQRNTLVREIDAESEMRKAKIKSDAYYQAVCEVIFGIFIVLALMDTQDDIIYNQKQHVITYLYVYLCVNGLFGLIKLTLFGSTVMSRPVSKTELMKIVTQVAQSFANFVLFILTFTTWTGV